MNEKTKNSENVLYEEKVPVSILEAVFLIPFSVLLLSFIYKILSTPNLSLYLLFFVFLLLIMSVNIFLIFINGVLVKVTDKEIIIASYLRFFKRAMPFSMATDYSEQPGGLFSPVGWRGFGTSLGLLAGFDLMYTFKGWWVAIYSNGLIPNFQVRLKEGGFKQVMFPTNNPKKLMEVLDKAGVRKR